MAKMKDKDTIVRNYILQQLEDGTLKEGDKLLAARAISAQINVSFVKVQQAIESLVKDGVLETVPRQGTFVQKAWSERILQTNLSGYGSYGSELAPSLKKLADIFSRHLPQLRVCSKFDRSVFEIKTTLELQSKKNDYLDLSEIFDKYYPDKSMFFKHPFKTFYINGELPGIPFIFSPRVMMFNSKLLKDAGCKLPDSAWTWEDFIDSIRKLKKTLPAENIFHWHPFSHLWINFVFRAGGCLIDPHADDPVQIDNPKTQYGLQLFTDLRNELGIKGENKDFRKNFLDGKAAFIVAPREFLPRIIESGLEDWSAVQLPSIEGGADVTAQATDLICIRKTCTDPKMAGEIVKLMLSEEVQDFIATERYGIPIRKSSAFKSIDVDDSRDSLFLSEASKISAEYNIDSPELSTLVRDGIGHIWSNGNDVKKTTKELADAVRVFMKIKNEQKLKEGLL